MQAFNNSGGKIFLGNGIIQHSQGIHPVPVHRCKPSFQILGVTFWVFLDIFNFLFFLGELW